MTTYKRNSTKYQTFILSHILDRDRILHLYVTDSFPHNHTGPNNRKCEFETFNFVAILFLHQGPKPFFAKDPQYPHHTRNNSQYVLHLSAYIIT